MNGIAVRKTGQHVKQHYDMERVTVAVFYDIDDIHHTGSIEICVHKECIPEIHGNTPALDQPLAPAIGEIKHSHKLEYMLLLQFYRVSHHLTIVVLQLCPAHIRFHSA
jgi:hypothetical protein